VPSEKDRGVQNHDLEEHWKRRPSNQYLLQEEEKAVAMIERFNRMFTRTLRALRDLRRYGGQIRIESARQVNIGDKQINVSST
jgi:oxalate decarboxylase/phosphoglucose isomerase-like protein (cupin superfamily)